MTVKTPLTQMLGIDFPVIMAPMFLVTNENMLKAAMKNGLAGAFPSLNYRKKGELEELLDRLNLYKTTCLGGTYGVNLIVQKTNPLFQLHLEVCVQRKVPFYITSLGNPKPVIEAAHAYGAKVFCDVTNIEHAKKCFELGCDAFIAVGSEAGGHAGPEPLINLTATLLKTFPSVPVIAAGGIANGKGLKKIMSAGACGASIGTRFIASTECEVSDAYKQAIVKARKEDIVMTEKLSGTPCAIINTPYAQKLGLKQSRFEKWMSQQKRTKRWFKLLVQLRGMKKLAKALQPGNYQNLWCAGQSVEDINDIKSIDQISEELKMEFKNT